MGREMLPAGLLAALLGAGCGAAPGLDGAGSGSGLGGEAAMPAGLAANRWELVEVVLPGEVVSGQGEEWLAVATDGSMVWGYGGCHHFNADVHAAAAVDPLDGADGAEESAVAMEVDDMEVDLVDCDQPDTPGFIEAVAEATTISIDDGQQPSVLLVSGPDLSARLEAAGPVSDIMEDRHRTFEPWQPAARSPDTPAT